MLLDKLCQKRPAPYGPPGVSFRFESDVAYTQFTLVIAMVTMMLGSA